MTPRPSLATRPDRSECARNVRAPWVIIHAPGDHCKQHESDSEQLKHPGTSGVRQIVRKVAVPLLSAVMDRPADMVAADIEYHAGRREVIRALRTADGMRQADIAAAAGISTSHYTNMENGRRPFRLPLDAIEEIADLLHVQVATISDGPVRGAATLPRRQRKTS